MEIEIKADWNRENNAEFISPSGIKIRLIYTKQNYPERSFCASGGQKAKNLDLKKQGSLDFGMVKWLGALVSGSLPRVSSFINYDYKRFFFVSQ